MAPRRALIGGFVATALVASLACAPTLLKSAVQKEAEARGFTIRIDDFSLRPGRLVLRGVEIADARGASRAHFDEVAAHFQLSGLRGFALRGGNVEFAGGLDELLARWAQIRGDRSTRATAGPGEAAQRWVIAEQIDVSWVESGVQRVVLERLHASVDPENVLISAREVKADFGSLRAKVEGPELALSRKGLRVTSALANRTEIELTVQRTDAENEASAGSQPVSPPAPSASSGALGLDLGRGARIRALLASLRAQAIRHLSDQTPILLRPVQVVIARTGRRLELSPAQIELSASSEQLVARFSTLNSGEIGGLDATFEVPAVSGPVRASLSAGPIRLSNLGVREGNWGFVGVDAAQVTLATRMELSANAEEITFSTSGSVRDVGLQSARLAPEPLTGLAFSWDVAGQAATSGGSLRLHSGQVALGAVASRVQLDVERNAERLKVNANLRVPRGSCQQMFDSLPSAAAPLLQGAKLKGEFAWQAGLVFDSDRLLDTQASWHMENRCRFTEIPQTADPERFREPFAREVPGIDDEPMFVESGPGTPNWVPLVDVSPHLETAVLTTEDGGFWRHHGFDQHAIEEAIRQNLAAGSFQRGASTLSMQLAKNLYLTRDKYLARKVQEALLTMLLEQEMEKSELLELYFNIVEFGPGVYGIGPAARYYFHSTPRELSVAQSFFLASLLPRPSAQHFDERGQLNAKWRAYLNQLMRIAHKRGRLSEQAMTEGLNQIVHFGVPDLLTNPYRTDGGDAAAGNESDADWVEPPDAEGR